MKRLTIAAFGALLTALVASGFGCELIANVDRTKIDTGGGGQGGTPTGGGGQGGTPTGGGGQGGTPTGGGGQGGTGGGLPCTTPADCDPPAGECFEATCDGSVCGEAPKMAGTPVAMQTAGDCKVAQCDGAGAVLDANDDADLPVDDNECTDDVCAAGEPSNPPVAEDSPCGANGMLHCNALGQCVGCLDAADCGTDTECQAHSCDMGACDVANTMQGTPLATQTGGDCKVEQCDGMGGVETADDNADVPADGTVCTDDVCASGMPSNPPVAADTMCMEGTGTLCDGDGACVECNDPTDCPGADDECQVRSCTAGVCGVTFTMAGTPLASQAAGDCKQAVCDGAGNVTTANDDADLPNDNNTCTSDTCAAGTPTFTNVMAGTTCGAAGVCDANGQCVGCNAPADCPGADDECKARTCVNNVCGLSFTAANTAVAAQTAGDCKQDVCDGSGNIISQNANGDTPPDDGNQCTSQTCSNGTPAFPAVPVDTACNQNGGSFCSAAGQCVACTQASQCPAGDECKTATCSANTCGFSFLPNGTVTPTQTTGDCKVNQCDGAGNVVQATSNGDVPNDSNDCTGDVCTAGVPSHPALIINTACGAGGASFCNGAGACVACNVGTQCPGSDTECQTRTCNSNVCGTSFTASGTPVAAQTAGDCKQNQCNGSGSVTIGNLDSDVPVDGNECTDDVCTAGVPSNPNEPPNTVCNQNGGTVCDGAGVCVSAACNDGAKNGDETDIDCGGSCSDCVDGKVCGVNGDCVSGVCTGNVCQAPACNDGVKNGTESDVDCGGSCPACANGKVCGGNSDCSSAVCSGGTCVQCATAAQCPAGDECKTATCNSNTCGFSFTAAGFVTSSQAAGNCQQNQCDGAGNITSVADNLDTPVDGIECTDDVCTAGVPSNPAKALDVACGAGGASFCDGAGACVQCTQASQCPAGDECKTATCNSNTCGFSFTAAGFVTSSQMPGDCKQNQCDGAGNSAPVNLDSDLPVDGNDCTGDVCTAGVASNPPLALNTACNQGGGTICDGLGACVSPPAVASTTPADGAASVLAGATLAITFTKAMNPATLTGQTDLGACSGSIQLSTDNFATCLPFSAAAPVMSGGNTIATFTPAPGLSFGTTYKVKVLGTVADSLGLTMGTAFTMPTGFATRTDVISGPGVVISQVYGQGSNASAAYNADYVELHNRGTSAVDIGGWSIQYASSGGNFGNNSLKFNIPAGVMVAAGKYYLVQMSTPGATGAALSADAASGTNINMSGSAGKVALVNNTTLLPVTTCALGNAALVDLVGYGSQVAGTGCWETLPAGGTAATHSSTQATFRRNAGCDDSANNSADFEVLAPNPRNASAAALVCSVSVNEKNVATELDYCNLQFPTSLDVQTGMATPTIYAQAYEAGVTDPAGAAANLVAQIGYGPTTVNPETQSGWTWVNGTFNTNVGSNDEWQAQITAPAPGTYRYTSRFSFDGVQWTYCDLNGAGSNAGLTFEINQLPTMTVTP